MHALLAVEPLRLHMATPDTPSATRLDPDEPIRSDRTRRLLDSRILIVDDQEVTTRFLERLLRRAGYTRIVSTNDARSTLALFNDFQPDLVLLDLHMPELSGFEVIRQLQGVIPDPGYLPILVLTADITPEARRQALSMGGKDFLSKPFDATEALQRIRNLLETRVLYLELQDQNRHLEATVRERTRQLEQMQVEILERLALAAEYRDDTTGEHTQRVGQTAAFIAQALGLTERDVALIRRAAPLHDIGKIGIPDTILLKPGKLAPGEFELMKTHTVIGARILSGGHFPLLQLAESIALTHHERWDGGGYTPGLEGEAIPLAGRIVAVADAFDAMTHARAYKAAWPARAALAEMHRESGHQFDPRVVDAFENVLRHDDLLTVRDLN